MNVALTRQFEGFIEKMIVSGRYNNAIEVVCTALRKLQETEDDVCPPGSLKHLYTPEANCAEASLARCRM